MIVSALKKPKNKKWYSQWWGGLIIIFLGVFLSVSFASGIFVITVSSKLKSGEISPEKLFGKKYVASYAEKMYGINSPTIGDDSALVKMVVFVDFTSPKSREASLAVNKVMFDEYYKKQVKFYFRHFPDAENPVSIAAALASECAHEEGRYIEMHNTLFDEVDLSRVEFAKAAQKSGLDSEKFAQCFQAQQNLFRVEKDFNDGKDLGVREAPTFFINGKMVEGTPRVEDIKKAIDLLLIKT